MDPIGFAAVVLAFAVPLAAIYAWYRVRKLRTEERLAAIAKGVSVPIAEELPPHARSRKAAILLIAGGLGYTCLLYTSLLARKIRRISLRGLYLDLLAGLDFD